MSRQSFLNSRPLKAPLFANQDGIATFDFIFSLIISWGFLIVFFSLAITFSFIQVAQYVAYSTSRSFYSAAVDPQRQIELAAAKFDQLRRTPLIRSLNASGWFALDPFTIQSKTDFNDEYASNSADSEQGFVGVRLRLQAMVLQKRIPFLGRTYEDDRSFSTFVTSFLGREVTDQECLANFNQQRFKNILNFGYSNSPNLARGMAYYQQTIFTDNGC